MEMETKLALFIAENNLPLSMSDGLCELLTQLFPDDSRVKKLSLGKTKCTNVIRQVLGFGFMAENVEYLRENKFSIIIDETTDNAPCARW
jgi:hypothetical protein